ncbi:ATP-dependent DNA ligase [Mariniluteicoccus endophyticus]
MLPIDMPLAPMLARPSATIPRGMAYEPKWDGWRALLVRDGDEVRLWSRHGTDLTVYFPDLVAAGRWLPERCVLDGECVVISGDRLDYTKLASRHATAARAHQLAREIPASFVAFDVLCFDDTSLLDQPWQVRRSVLETLADHWEPPILLSPVTYDHDVAQEWFENFESAGLDGVVAKPLEGKYLPGARAITKIKHRRTADVVVGGFRYDRNSTEAHPSLGSLVLGLVDDDGGLNCVGVVSGFPGSQRKELAQMLATLEVERGTPEFHGHPWSPGSGRATGVRMPDGVERWSEPREQVHLISPLLVCEVTFDYLHDGIRFRSNADFVRWRPDREPASCGFDQVDTPPGLKLSDVLAPE